MFFYFLFFFCNDTATTEIYTSDTLFPYTTLFRSVQKGCHAESLGRRLRKVNAIHASERMPLVDQLDEAAAVDMRVNFGRRDVGVAEQDRKSTRLNSSH